MKKSLIITIGVVLILLVLGVWLYLLFFGTPGNSNDVFANLGIGSSQVEQTIQEPVEVADLEPTTQIDTKKDSLRQLTTRPVAGFTFVGTSTELIRYAERGTGHIYEINIENGTELRITGTTIPRAVEAEFSSSGDSVALIAETNNTSAVVAGTINEEESSIDFIALPENSYAPTFVSENTLRYAVTNANGTEGYELDVRENEPVRIFSIPFRDVEILFKTETYAYNRPTASLKGSLYNIDSKLTPVTPGEFGFVGGVNDEYYFGSAIVDGKFVSYAIDKTTEGKIPLATTFIPEKCTTIETKGGALWCAAPLEILPSGFIESWYKGAVQSEDLLWKVDVSRGEALLQSDFLRESGRVVDVDKMRVDFLGITPVFRNKIDNTLWLYDTRVE